jgi:hypothetical protein
MRHERYRAVDACLLQPQARRILAARIPEGKIQTDPLDRERRRKAIRPAVHMIGEQVADFIKEGR